MSDSRLERRQRPPRRSDSEDEIIVRVKLGIASQIENLKLLVVVHQNVRIVGYRFVGSFHNAFPFWGLAGGRRGGCTDTDRVRLRGARPLEDLDRTSVRASRAAARGDAEGRGDAFGHCSSEEADEEAKAEG